jgi:hypothetical protein
MSRAPGADDPTRAQIYPHAHRYPSQAQSPRRTPRVMVMDRNELIQIIQDLDARLTASFDVIAVGGAAMILHFQAQRATRDIDVLVLRGNLTERRAAVRAVAQERAMPENWLSDAVNGFAAGFSNAPDAVGL